MEKFEKWRQINNVNGHVEKNIEIDILLSVIAV
jgi:hypothetical protein